MRVLTLFLSLALITMLGCERTTEEPPDTGPRRDAGSDAPPATDAPEPDGALPDGGLACRGPSGCWSCEPTELAHFLDGCTDSSCEPFPVTTARLPLLRADGSLPPLP